MESTPPPPPTCSPWITRHAIDARGRVVAAIILGAIVVALIAIAVKDPRTHGLGVLCPSRRFLGIYCPGCGSTRATHALLHGELARAFRSNPIFVLLGAPLLVGYSGALLWSIVRRERVAVHLPPWIGYAAAAFLVLYGIARNVPGEAFDPLRPPPSAVSSVRPE